MLFLFLDYRVFLHSKFVLNGFTVNQECYLQVMQRLNKNVSRIRPICVKKSHSFCIIITHPQQSLHPKKRSCCKQNKYNLTTTVFTGYSPRDCLIIPNISISTSWTPLYVDRSYRLQDSIGETKPDV